MERHHRIALPGLACILLGGLALAAATEERETVLFEENFDGNLKSGWSWVREDPEAWKVKNGELALTVQPGYLNPWGKDKEAHNLLLRDPPDKLGAAWAVELMLDSEPRTQFEHAGPLIYWNDDNYVSLFRENLDGKPKLQMVAVKNDQAAFVVVDKDVRPVWLRLAVDGETITAQYRASEKGPWQTVGTKTRVSAGAFRCGLISGGAPKDAGREAAFSHFRIVRQAGG
jgi:regulation of enolase protein 1 (concanavalin A-like superfamily)